MSHKKISLDKTFFFLYQRKRFELWRHHGWWIGQTLCNAEIVCLCIRFGISNQYKFWQKRLMVILIVSSHKKISLDKTFFFLYQRKRFELWRHHGWWIGQTLCNAEIVCLCIRFGISNQYKFWQKRLMVILIVSTSCYITFFLNMFEP